VFEQSKAIFLLNLVQDANVLRPLVFMAARDFGFRVVILVSPKFGVRDMFGIWQAELDALREQLGVEVHYYRNEWEAFRHLSGTGVIFAGSESSLREHDFTHAVFRYAPAGFLRVTLQHGFECVGFRHNAAHDQAYGAQVSSGADILCAWQRADLQPSMPRAQRAKMWLTGPTSVLQSFTGPIERGPRAPGIVCENLHSLRLNVTKQLKHQFVATFSEYCQLLQADGGEVVLRPHPGGQYVLKNEIELPPNARVNNAPMYRLDLRQFAYGISAPSSVLLDMLLADIPVAVWRDDSGGIDASNYDGIAHVSSPNEWLEFAREASARPQPFIDAQRLFLNRESMPTDPRDVFARYAEIFQAAERIRVSSPVRPVERQRLLIVANAHLPTVQACLERPLSALVRAGEIVTDLLTEARLRHQQRLVGSDEAVAEWVTRSLDLFAPDAIIFSRYSGPHSQVIVKWARNNSVPVIYQIDDDLLSVPPSLGKNKYAYHNAPERLAAVRGLLRDADLVYVSTDRLRDRLLDDDPDIRAVAGRINCSGRVMRSPQEGPTRTIGYTASADHLANLEMVLPAIVETLDRHPDLSFELFGSIPVPSELERFGERVRSFPVVADYEEFLRKLGERRWHIGICPLAPTDFNRGKSNNKWVEYTAVGTATIASAAMVYDECCSDGCGLLADGLDEWRGALEKLVADAALRVETVARAQQKLELRYGTEQHRQQILDIIEQARGLVTAEPRRAHVLHERDA
jgi:glycosyltransferase involved in cell wall biosynthesis